MKRIKTGIFAILMVVAVASFTVCKATGSNSVEAAGKDGVLSDKAVSAFNITAPVEASGVIDEAGRAITVNVPYGTAVTGMTATFEYSGASVSPASGTTDIDFTTPQTFTVTALDGSKQAYTATVNVGSRTSKEIAYFSITSPVAAVGVIDEAGRSIALSVPLGTAVSGMNILVSHTGVSIDPSGTTGLNFAAPKTFTVKAADDSTRAYTVTVNGLTGSYEVRFDSSDGGTAPATRTWRGGPGLTLPDAGSMAKDALFFCGWAEDSDAGAYAASPYTPTRDVTLHALWRDIQGIIDESLARLDAAPKVIGNPADNSDEARVLSDVIAELMTLLEGETDVRTINTDTTDGTEETYKVYDYPAIYKKSGELEALSADFSGEIIVESMYFQYVAATDENTDPYQRIRLKTAGVYEIELAGAAGGHIWTRINLTGTGGKGGHVRAEYNAGGNVDVDVRVGGQGQGTAHFNAETSTYTPVHTTNNTSISYTVSVDGRKAWEAQKGGYNGGGSGGGSYSSDGLVSNYTAGSGGGGATDVRLVGGAELTGMTDDPRIAVAGGGGGGAQGTSSGTGNVGLLGGNAGGETGAAGVADISANSPTGGTPSNGGLQPSCNTTPAAGEPGKGRNGVNGSSGSSTVEGRGGGGAGWWGGGAMTTASGSNAIAAGAGGSSYTGGAGSITPNTSALTPVNETIVGNVWDDGWARITWKR